MRESSAQERNEKPSFFAFHVQSTLCSGAGLLSSPTSLLAAKVLAVNHIDDQEDKDHNNQGRNQLVGCHASLREEELQTGEDKGASQFSSHPIALHNHMPKPFQRCYYLPTSHALQCARCLVNVRVCLQELLSCWKFGMCIVSKPQIPPDHILQAWYAAPYSVPGMDDLLPL
jgi:hypothetical protein